MANARSADNLSCRLRYALKLLGTRKADLAKAIDVKPQVIQFLCNTGTKTSRFTFEIAAALGLNTRWLATGDGEMFLADDPKHKLFKQYKKIPLLSQEQLIAQQLSRQPIDNQQKWKVIDAASNCDFCFSMPDTSMQHHLPRDSLVFFAMIEPAELKDKDIIMAYLTDCHSIVIRNLVSNQGSIFLSPDNKKIFNTVTLSDKIKVIAKAIECHWKIETN